MNMKKFLLSACVALLTLTATAQMPGTFLWDKQLSPASEAAAVQRRAPLAVAADGSILATGTFDQPLTIGTTQLENIATSAYLAKYDSKGNALWAVSLAGAATITAVTVDDEGNAFVAGTFADKVEVGSTDKAKKTIEGQPDVTAQVSAFVAKYDGNGKLQTVRTFLPTKGEAPGLEYSPELFVRPNKLQVAYGKVYLSLFFAGDVKTDKVNWSARYLNVFDFMAQDLTSAGILTLNDADLSAATSVALFQNEEAMAAVQAQVEDVNFIVDAGTLYAAFAGAGTKVLTTAGGTETVNFTVDGDKQEHGFVVAAIGAQTQTKVFHNEAHDKLYSTDLVRAMAIKGDKLYLGGTFFNKLPFKPEVVSTGAADLFVAALNKSDLAVTWASASGLDEGDANKVQEVMTGLLVEKDQVFATGYVEQKANRAVEKNISYNFTATGATTAGDNGLIGASATNGTLYAVHRVEGQQTSLVTFDVSKVTSIAAIAPHRDAPTAVYTLDGKRVSSDAHLPAGIYLIKTADSVRKVIVQ